MKPYEEPITRNELLLLEERAKKEREEKAPLGGINSHLRAAFCQFISGCQSLRQEKRGEK